MWPAESKIFTIGPLTQQICCPRLRGKHFRAKGIFRICLCWCQTPASSEPCPCCQGLGEGNLGIFKNTGCFWRNQFPFLHTEHTIGLQMTQAIQIEKDS